MTGNGVGVEKLSSMCVQFAPAELEQMRAPKRAFDRKGAAHPGKAIPSLTLRRVRQDACAAGCPSPTFRGSENLAPNVNVPRCSASSTTCGPRRPPARSSPFAAAPGLLRGDTARRACRTRRCSKACPATSPRTGRHRALRHPARRAGGHARREGPRLSAALRSGRHGGRHGGGGTRGPGARRSARCAITCSATMLNGRGEALTFGGQVMKTSPVTTCRACWPARSARWA